MVSCNKREFSMGKKKSTTKNPPTKKNKTRTLTN